MGIYGNLYAGQRVMENLLAGVGVVPPLDFMSPPLELEQLLLDLPIRITKLKDIHTHLRVQILISIFHVEHSVPTFLPRWRASDLACK